jgi:hypothetical protein
MSSVGLVTWKLYVLLRSAFVMQEGQDLVEYALILTLFALGATASMYSVAEKSDQILMQLGEVILLNGAI